MGSYLLLRFSSMGDVVLATAAARLLRARRPGCRVVFATKAAFAPLLASHPDVDEVWTLESEGLAGLARRARARRFDAVVDLHSSPRSRLVAGLSGAPVSRWRSMGLQRRLRVWRHGRPGAATQPVHLRFAAAAAAALGGPDPDPGGSEALPRLGVDPEAAAWAEGWLAERGVRAGEPLLAVAPGAAWATKRWGVGPTASCLDALAGAGGRTLLVGGPHEGPLLDALEAALGGPARAKTLRSDGATGDLRRLAALIARCRHFLGNDSGPLHVADALGVPVTAVFGPTVEAFGFFPVGPGRRVFERALACRPCAVHGGEACPLGHHDCMRATDPLEVARHVRSRLGEGGAG